MAISSSAQSILTLIRSTGGEPLHRQVEARIRQLAVLSEYQNGAFFPDELTIANRFGVSRGTARAALSRLVHEGILERKAGLGTKVARARGQSGIRAWRSFSREMEAKGIKVQNFSTSFSTSPATSEAAIALQIAPGTMVHRLDRLRGWDNRPVLLSCSWLHPRLQLDGKEDFSLPLYNLLEKKCGVIADSAREDFTAIVASAAMAGRLKTRPGTPLLLRHHTVFDANGRPIEYAAVRYVSARFTLTLDLRRE